LKVALSIDREFEDYAELRSTLEEVAKTEGFIKFVSLDHKMAAKFAASSKIGVEIIPIIWDATEGSKNLKPNKFGKMYDADAPLDAAKKVVASSTHILELGRGDFNISRLSKDILETIEVDKSTSDTSKRYKF